jgi:hypothetical protein
MHPPRWETALHLLPLEEMRYCQGWRHREEMMQGYR